MCRPIRLRFYNAHNDGETVSPFERAEGALAPLTDRPLTDEPLRAALDAQAARARHIIVIQTDRDPPSAAGGGCDPREAPPRRQARLGGSLNSLWEKSCCLVSRKSKTVRATPSSSVNTWLVTS